MRMRLASLIVPALVATICQISLASAQPLPVTPEGSFVTLDRVGAGSRWGTQLHINPFPRTDDVAVRIDAFGRWMSESGFGGYGQFAVVHATDGVTPTGATTPTPENLELGGLYALQRGDLQAVARAGLVLPTLADGGEEIAHLVLAERVTDYPAIAEGGWWLRLSISPRIDRGRWFAQADGGVDLPFDREDPGGEASTADLPLYRLNAAAGGRTGRFAVTGEFAMHMRWSSDIQASSFDASLAASVRHLGTAVEPYLGIVKPIDLDGYVPPYVLTLGVEGPL